MTAKKKTAETWVATRGVSWKVGEGWVNREAGDDVSDAPETVLAELRSWPVDDPAVVTGAEWAAREKGAGDGES